MATPFNNFNLTEIYGAADRSNAMRDQQQFQQYQIQRQQREDQRADAGRNAYRIGSDGNLDEEGTFTQLMAVDPMQAMQFKQGQSKAKAEQMKLQTESRKADLENKTATAKYLRDAGSNVRDQSSYDAWRQEAASLGAQFANTLPPEYNPEVVRTQLYTADKFLEQSTPKFEKVDLGGKVQIIDVNPFTNPSIKGTALDKTQTPDSIASGKIQIRGQNMANQRASEANFLKSQENDIKRGEKIPENSTAIRKEFDQLPEVKNYKQALPSFKGIQDAVNRNTPASDINIVYGIAKLYDPNSVVREGEYATVANSPNIPEKIKGYAQYLSGGGKLSPDVKKQILTEAKSRMKTFEDQYSSARDNYTEIAKRSNADPSLVLPGQFQPAVDTKKPPTAPTIKPGKVEDGYVYLGGDPAQPTSWKKAK